jgi:hypothetical protein
MINTRREWAGYLVWGFLGYGLTSAVEATASWLGTRITGIAESVLYALMLITAAFLLVYAFDTPTQEY